MNELNIVPVEIHYDVVSKRPTLEEVERLAKESFPEKEMSDAERNRVSSNMGLGFFAALCSVGLYFWGNWLNDDRNLNAISRLFGLALVYLATPIGVLCGTGMIVSAVASSLSSGRKKSAESSLRWIWMAILDTGSIMSTSENGFAQNTKYALARCNRAIPGDLDLEKMKRWIRELRESLGNVMSGISLPLMERIRPHTNLTVKRGSLDVRISVEGSEEISKNAAIIRARISVQDSIKTCGENNETKVESVSAILTLHIAQVFIKTGEYWYPYDLTPTFTERVQP